MRDFWWRNGDVRLHAVVAGTGRALILLHGWPGFWRDWERVVGPLSSSTMLVLPDLRDFGFSDKPERVEDYSLDKYAGDLEALMEALGLKRAVIAGFGAFHELLRSPLDLNLVGDGTGVM